MTIEQLKYYLEKGNSFGFTKDTNNSSIVGWFLLKQLKPIPRYREILDVSQDAILFKEQENIVKAPYYIEVCELEKRFFESNNSWPEEENYIMNKNYRFSNLEEVKHFFKKYGKCIHEIKWITDIPSM